MASNGNVILWCSSSVVQRNIKFFLQENAYTIFSCECVEDVRTALSIDDYRLLITDTCFPNESLEYLLQKYPKLPVFHITSCMPVTLPSPPHFLYTLPFDLEEIEKLLGPNSNPFDQLPLGNYAILPQKNILRCKNTEIYITKKEMELLLILYRNRPNIVSKGDISRKLWPKDSKNKETSISVYINNLRKYFARDKSIQFISIYGKGIRLDSK